MVERKQKKNRRKNYEKLGRISYKKGGKAGKRERVAKGNPTQKKKMIGSPDQDGGRGTHQRAQISQHPTSWLKGRAKGKGKSLSGGKEFQGIFIPTKEKRKREFRQKFPFWGISPRRNTLHEISNRKSLETKGGERPPREGPLGQRPAKKKEKRSNQLYR